MGKEDTQKDEDRKSQATAGEPIAVGDIEAGPVVQGDRVHQRGIELFVPAAGFRITHRCAALAWPVGIAVDEDLRVYDNAVPVDDR